MGWYNFWSVVVWLSVCVMGGALIVLIGPVGILVFLFMVALTLFFLAQMKKDYESGGKQ